MKVSRTSIGLASLSLLALAGCPVTGGALCDNGTCEAAVDATATQPADAGPDGIVVAPRDECVDKPTSPECLTNETAIFVSKTADPAVADGTIAKPYASIATALGKVTSEKKRVYVCEGTYEEQVTIETVPATLIGGIACDFRTPGPKAKIAPKNGIAFGIAAVGGASVIDVAIEAVSDVNAPGSSAIGMFITSSTDILLRGVDITAAAGQPGVDGTDGNTKPNHTNQLAPTGVTGGGGGAMGVAPTCTACVDGNTSKAGNGGAVTPSFAFAASGDATPKVPGQIANGGTSAPGSCTNGNPGAHGGAGVKATGGTVPGQLAAKSWTDRTTTAVAGKSGGPGQGGGGGGTLTMSGGGGGSGACGGCGGTGGGAGTDGGSSIGILVYQSTKIVLEKSTVVTADGGKGGNGGDGEAGQEAPSAGALGGGGNACNGGAGGQGAGGGGGGGGAGGYSAAIAYLGEAPQTPQSVLTPGGAGTSGTGGKGGAAGTAAGNEGEDGTDGAPSKAEAVLNLAP